MNHCTSHVALLCFFFFFTFCFEVNWVPKNEHGSSPEGRLLRCDGPSRQPVVHQSGLQWGDQCCCGEKHVGVCPFSWSKLMSISNLWGSKVKLWQLARPVFLWNAHLTHSSQAWIYFQNKSWTAVAESPVISITCLFTPWFKSVTNRLLLGTRMWC